MSYDEDDGDSIQFMQQDETDSIQFVEEGGGGLDGTARSTGTRRSRAVSIRSGKPDNASFASSSAPGNWFTAGIAATTNSSSAGGSPREGEPPQPRPMSIGSAMDSNDDEDGAGVTDTRRRQRRARITATVVSTDNDDDDDDATPDLPGTSSSAHRGLAGHSSSTKSATSLAAGKPPAGGVKSGSQLSLATPSLSPPHRGASTYLSNHSIVFTVLDEGEEEGGDDGGGASTAGAASGGVVASSMVSGMQNVSATTAALHKTVVSDTMRQRGLSLRSLKGSRPARSGTATASAPQPLPQAASSAAPTRAATTTAQGPTTAAIAQAAPGANAPSDHFPTFVSAAGNSGGDGGGASGGGALPVPPVAAAATTTTTAATPSSSASVVAHGRTDSSKLVLEHLLDQEASNVFVQHKAKMLTSPTSGVAPPPPPESGTVDALLLLTPPLATPPPSLSTAAPGQRAAIPHSAPTPSAAVPMATPRSERCDRFARGDVAQEKKTATSTPLGREEGNATPRNSVPTGAAAAAAAAMMRAPSQQRSGRTRSGSGNGGKLTGDAKPPRTGEQRIRSNSNGAGGGALGPSSSSSVAGRGGALVATLPTEEVELFQARALTNQVRHFNELQLGDLMRLDERLAAARLNTTVAADRVAELRGAVLAVGDRRHTQPGPVQRRVSNADAPTSSVGEQRRIVDCRHKYVDNVPATTSTGGDKHLARPVSMSPPPRRRCVQEKDVSVIVRQTAQALGVLPPASSEWKSALAHGSVSSPSLSSPTASKGVPHLFFTTGVRLTSEQQSQFYRLVRRRVKGHDEVDGDVVAQLLVERHPELRNVAAGGVVTWEQQGSGRQGPFLSSHNRRSHSPPSRILVEPLHGKTPTTNVLVTNTAEAATAALQRGPKRIHRTEVVRYVFDLLDMEHTGILYKSDLDSLRDALHEECDLFRVPSLGSGGGGTHRCRLVGGRHHPEGGGRLCDQSLIATAVASKVRTDSAFLHSGTLPTPATTTTAAVSAPDLSCPFRKYGCHSRDEFRKLCQFAADVVIPILLRSNMEEFEFPHVSMLLLSQAGPQSWLPMETRKTLTGFLEFFRETLH